MASVTESMSRQQIELETAIANAAARAQWSEHDRAKSLQVILRSPRNSAFDEQIASLMQELQGMLQELQRGEVKEEQASARYIARARALVERLGTAYQGQSTYLIGQLNQVRAKNNPAVAR